LATMRVRTSVAVLLGTGTLLAGCHSSVPGTPSTQAGTPTVTSSAPTTSTNTASAQKPPPTSPPTDAKALPNENGYSFIATKSGQTRCQLDVATVGCEAQFANAPVIDGLPANGVEITADGKQRWLVGNIGDPPVVTLDYRTYTAQGWTIVAAEVGTRFTNDRTGHGMFVSLEKVEPF
jgi:hypothetical protein